LGQAIIWAIQCSIAAHKNNNPSLVCRKAKNTLFFKVDTPFTTWMNRSDVYPVVLLGLFGDFDDDLLSLGHVAGPAYLDVATGNNYPYRKQILYFKRPSLLDL